MSKPVHTLHVACMLFLQPGIPLREKSAFSASLVPNASRMPKSTSPVLWLHPQSLYIMESTSSARSGIDICLKLELCIVSRILRYFLARGLAHEHAHYVFCSFNDSWKLWKEQSVNINCCRAAEELAKQDQATLNGKVEFMHLDLASLK